MKIGSRVYVSILSRSKVAGEAGTLIGSSARDGYKIRTDFGTVGYVRVAHVRELVADAPVEGETKESYCDVVHSMGIKEIPAQCSRIQAEDGFVPSRDVELLYPAKVNYDKYIVDTDVASAYLTPILPIEPSDLVARAVRFDSPFHRPTCGWVSDQWIEDGVELLNIVHDGDFTVIPRRFITDVFTVMSKHKNIVRIIAE